MKVCFAYAKHEDSAEYIGNFVKKDKVTKVGESIDDIYDTTDEVKKVPSKVKIEGSAAPNFKSGLIDTYKTIVSTSGIGSNCRSL